MTAGGRGFHMRAARQARRPPRRPLRLGPAARARAGPPVRGRRRQPGQVLTRTKNRMDSDDGGRRDRLTRVDSADDSDTRTWPYAPASGRTARTTGGEGVVNEQAAHAPHRRRCSLAGRPGPGLHVDTSVTAGSQSVTDRSRVIRGGRARSGCRMRKWGPGPGGGKGAAASDGRQHGRR